MRIEVLKKMHIPKRQFCVLGSLMFRQLRHHKCMSLGVKINVVARVTA